MLTSTGKSVWSKLPATSVLFMVMALRNWNDRSNQPTGVALAVLDGELVSVAAFNVETL